MICVIFLWLTHTSGKRVILYCNRSHNNDILLVLVFNLFMTAELESYYLSQPEPIQGCLLALRRIILNADNQITETRKYQVPFYYYKEKNCHSCGWTGKNCCWDLLQIKRSTPLSPDQKGKTKWKWYKLIRIKIYLLKWSWSIFTGWRNCMIKPAFLILWTWSNMTFYVLVANESIYRK